MRLAFLILLNLGWALAATQTGAPLADGGYTIKNFVSNLVLDDPGHSQVAGTQVIQWGGNGGLNQTWQLAYDSVQGGYLISNGEVPQLFLSDINGALDLEYQNSVANQYWALDARPSGWQIRNLNTGRVIDNPGGNKTAGTKIITYGANNGTNQEWILGLVGAPPPPVTTSTRFIYGVNESGTRGSISVYDIDNGHKLVKTIQTVSGVGDVRGLAASSVTGKLYVSYNATDTAKTGMMFAMDIASGTILWNRAIAPDVDRMAVSPDGQLIYSPTSEDQANTYINVLDANTGDVVRKVYFSSHSHDTQYPLSGPIFQETKAKDGTGKYLYMVDPQSYAVSNVGPFHDFLGPYAVDAQSRYAVADVNGVVGFQVVDIQANSVATALIPNPPSGVSLPHGIGWTPNQTEVWQNTTGSDPHVYIWDMTNPMSPVFKQRLNLDNGGSHWITFDIKGDFAYIAPNKNSSNGTDVFNVATHTLAGKLASSEDLLEVDFDSNGRVAAVGDQYGIGR